MPIRAPADHGCTVTRRPATAHGGAIRIARHLADPMDLGRDLPRPTDAAPHALWIRPVRATAADPVAHGVVRLPCRRAGDVALKVAHRGQAQPITVVALVSTKTRAS